MPGRAFRSFLEIVGILAGAVALAFVLQAYLVKPFQIPSESMEPTIGPGDRILVNRLAYRYGTIERGDVIVFKSPQDPDVDFVKRVIAVAGDTVEVKQGLVILNGEPLIEPYVQAPDSSTFPSRQIPEDAVFVMGDNRRNSDDSRFWQPPWLPLDNVIGEAFIKYWPPERIGTL
ncbi:MAG: signal peptidase I [Thermoleophilia bacterium]|nr:signal peptidase I [Thermoleophilia bacterium]